LLIRKEKLGRLESLVLEIIVERFWYNAA
jgi:hypothetical protein